MTPANFWMPYSSN